VGTKEHCDELVTGRRAGTTRCGRSNAPSPSARRHAQPGAAVPQRPRSLSCPYLASRTRRVGWASPCSTRLLLPTVLARRHHHRRLFRGRLDSASAWLAAPGIEAAGTPYERRAPGWRTSCAPRRHLDPAVPEYAASFLPGARSVIDPNHSNGAPPSSRRTAESGCDARTAGRRVGELQPRRPVDHRPLDRRRARRRRQAPQPDELRFVCRRRPRSETATGPDDRDPGGDPSRPERPGRPGSPSVCRPQLRPLVASPDVDPTPRSATPDGAERWPRAPEDTAGAPSVRRGLPGRGGLQLR